MFRSYRTIAAVFIATLALAATGYAEPAKAKSHAVVGTLQKVDGQAITVQTEKGVETVMLMPDSRIHRGAQTIEAASLPTYTGQRVKLHYVESNGEKHAQTIAVASASRTAAAATPASSQASKQMGKTAQK